MHLCTEHGCVRDRLRVDGYEVKDGALTKIEANVVSWSVINDPTNFNPSSDG